MTYYFFVVLIFAVKKRGDNFAYRKVPSSRLSWLVAHLRIFRLFMTVKFDAYICTVSFGQKSSKLTK